MDLAADLSIRFDKEPVKMITLVAFVVDILMNESV
tara:strand:+ start:793 stop:897 length:105 start_codon:yes stop_codon:yes gene_type:complete